MTLPTVSPFIVRLRLFDGFGRRILLLLTQVLLQLLGSLQVVLTLGPDALCSSLTLGLICNTGSSLHNGAVLDFQQ